MVLKVYTFNTVNVLKDIHMQKKKRLILVCNYIRKLIVWMYLTGQSETFMNLKVYKTFPFAGQGDH